MYFETNLIEGTLNRQSLSKNLIFQFAYQAIILLIPLVLSPYLTRTLQETSIGVYTFTNSIAYYFVIISLLGISRYGQRVISQNSSNDIKLRKTFWGLFTVHSLISLFSFLCYLLFVFLFGLKDTVIYYIQSFYVLSALFDITWLFYGLENFRSVVVINAIVKVVECILIFAVVHNPDDLWKYTLITCGGMLLGQVILFIQAIYIIRPIRFYKDDVLIHIKPLSNINLNG